MTGTEIDYSVVLDSINNNLIAIENNLVAIHEIGVWLQGFALFGCVVVFCYFSYRFLRLFF